MRLFFRTAQHGKKLSLSGWKLGISIPLRTGPKPSKAADECAAETQQATSPPSGAPPGRCSSGLCRNAATERALGSQEPRIAACRRWAAARPPNRGLGRGACVSGVKPGPNRAAALGTWELRTDFRRRPPVTGRPDRGMYGPEAGRLGRFACPDAGRGPSKLPRHYLPSPRGKIIAHWNIVPKRKGRTSVVGLSCSVSSHFSRFR